MDAHETLRVELRLEPLQRLLLEVLAAAAVQRNVVILSFDVVDLVRLDHVDVRAFADQHALDRLLRPHGIDELGHGRDDRAQRQAAPHAIDRTPDPLLADRLQQVVDRVDFEGSHRMLVVGSLEDDYDIGTDQLEYLEAVQLGHLDVEEHEIGPGLCNLLDRVEAVAALCDDLHSRRAEQLAQQIARRRLVVDDHDPQRALAGRRPGGDGSVEPTFGRP